MKLDELYQRDLPLFEMANLEKEKTGITGFIYVSTKQASHGPRVKYFKKLGKGQPCFSVIISDNPQVVKSKGKSAFKMKEEEINAAAPAVIEFIKLNKDELLDFWFNGTDWPSEKFIAFLNNLKKVE